MKLEQKIVINRRYLPLDFKILTYLFLILKIYDFFFHRYEIIVIYNMAYYRSKMYINYKRYDIVGIGETKLAFGLR